MFGNDGIEKFKESYEKVFGMKLLTEEDELKRAFPDLQNGFTAKNYDFKQLFIHKDDKNLDLKSFKFGGKNFKTKIPWTGQGIEMEV